MLLKWLDLCILNNKISVRLGHSVRITYATHTFTLQLKSLRWRSVSKALRLMEPSWGYLQVFGLLTSGPVLPIHQSWHGVAACCSMAVQPLTWEGPGCLPPSQLKPQTEGKHYKASGVSTYLIHPVVYACASLLLFMTLAVARVGLVSNRQAHLWAWEWRNFQGCTERDSCLWVAQSIAASA